MYLLYAFVCWFITYFFPYLASLTRIVPFFYFFLFLLQFFVYFRIFLSLFFILYYLFILYCYLALDLSLFLFFFLCVNCTVFIICSYTCFFFPCCLKFPLFFYTYLFFPLMSKTAFIFSITMAIYTSPRWKKMQCGHVSRILRYSTYVWALELCFLGLINSFCLFYGVTCDRTFIHIFSFICIFIFSEFEYHSIKKTVIGANVFLFLFLSVSRDQMRPTVSFVFFKVVVVAFTLHNARRTGFGHRSYSSTRLRDDLRRRHSHSPTWKEEPARCRLP